MPSRDITNVPVTDPIGRINKTKERCDKNYKRYPNLDELAREHGTDKWWAHGYTSEVYPKFLDQIRFLPIKFLEIGVLKGQSARMWNEFFIHPNKELYFWDINPRCKNHVPKNSIFFVVNCEDEEQIDKTVSNMSMVDVVIDDGAHSPSSIRKSIKGLWNNLNPGGLYIVEDINLDHKRRQVILDFLGGREYSELHLYPEICIIRKYK